MVTIAGYELIQQIGAGGMASVWKARQLSLDRIVAIKILGKTSLPDQDALDRFNKEAQIAARLNHPAIVQVYDAGEVNGEAYLVMEFVDGHTVADEILQHNGLGEARALEIAATVAKALAYAWEKECLIHCDIKPDNILIDRNSGAIKVADLGLARMIGQFERRDEEHIIGTPNYIAPEQAAGVPDLDCRADMYALGATLYHMVTGVLPFRDAKGSAAMTRHEEEFLDDPQKINPTLSAPAAWLIEKLMIKNRALRPHFWTQVLKDFEQVRKNQMPFDPLPDEGCSTVRRASGRTSVPSGKSGATPVAGAPPAGRLKVRRPDLSATTRPAAKTKKRNRMMDVLTSVFVIGATGVAVWYFRGQPDLAQFPQLQPVIEKARALFASSAPAEDEAAVDAEDSAAPARSADVEQALPATAPAATWDSADFQEGARLYNEADAMYREFLKTRANPESLTVIESKSRSAIELFEKCRATAPANVPIDRYVSDSFRLISLVRKNMTAEQAAGPQADHAQPAAGSKPKITVVSSVEKPATPKVVFVDDEPEPAPVAEVVPPKPPAHYVDVALDPAWQQTPADAAGLSGELRGLLSRFAQPATVTAVDDSIVLYPGITAMMTAFEASRVLQQDLPIKRNLTGPGFPASSFYMYEFDGAFSGASRLTLVVDRNSRVLMVQLVDEKALPARLEDALFSPRWRVVDFLRARQLAGESEMVAHRARERDQLIRIDTEVAASAPAANGARTATFRAQLMIPAPLAGLILQASR